MLALSNAACRIGGSKVTEPLPDPLVTQLVTASFNSPFTSKYSPARKTVVDTFAFLMFKLVQS